MREPLRLAILGSTGSIGRQALEVAAAHPGRVDVVALAAHSNAELLAHQAGEHDVDRVALGDPESADTFRAACPGVPLEAGPAAVVRLAAEGADVVLNALVGAAGLRATVAALGGDARLALANKESLVVGGDLVTGLASPDRILPVDSEHSALFQCLVGEDPGEVAGLWLTASGGPFRGMDRRELAAVSVGDALAHPTWTMGPKITIDSATLMNKGLEVIEAHHLFGVPYDRIRVVVHPESCVHSMVEFTDGSVKAHLGATDMRVPIQYALSYPERWDAPVESVDFAEVGHLAFESPDTDTFRALLLAYEAGRTGGTMPCVLNAANEVAVERFLKGGCRLTDIDRVVEEAMDAHDPDDLESVEQIEETDAWARTLARDLLEDTRDA